MAPSAVEIVLVKQLDALQKPTLYVLSEFHPDAVAHAQSLFNCILPDSPKAANWRSHATAILIKDYYITAEDLAAAPQLRVIGKQGVGIEKIDAEACARAGVRIFNAPGVNSGCVAELVLTLTMSVARSVPALWVRMNNGETIRKETCDGMLLTGKTIGVIGMGNIGLAVARMFIGAFNATVIAFDPMLSPAIAKLWAGIPHIRVESLKEVLQASDVVTIHVPLTKGTKGMISYNELAMMQPTAILINAARGGIVDENDLCHALEENVIFGAGFDCHVQEPPTKEKYGRLWSLPNYVGAPHIGAATSETQVQTTNFATDAVYKFLTMPTEKQ